VLVLLTGSALGGSPSWAAPPVVVFKVGDQGQRFVIEDQTHLTISDFCAAKSRREKCRARVAIEQAHANVKALDDRTPRPGGINPGSILCKKAGGDVLIGFDVDQDEMTFCEFTDGSMVATDSLVYYALNKK
jgi:putative hemolysin